VRGVGGPVFAYRLTESGDALFPQAYAPLLSEALTVVREALGSDGVRQVLERRWAAVAAEIRPQLEGLPLTARVERLAALLTAHGYMAEAEVGPDGTSALRARHCALAAVAREHPEVCAAEADFLARMLDETIDRRARIIEGCRACEYTIGGARRATLERTG